LAAFHAALSTLGLAHYNLIRLSSVVPPGTTIDGSGAAPAPSGAWGDRLYCVYGERRETTPGKEAWAGMGWVHRIDGGGGLLVEHEGESEELVTEAIQISLRDMVGDSADQYSRPGSLLSGVRCTGQAVCALVIAPFHLASWHMPPGLAWQRDFSEFEGAQ